MLCVQRVLWVQWVLCLQWVFRKMHKNCLSNRNLPNCNCVIMILIQSEESEQIWHHLYQVCNKTIMQTSFRSSHTCAHPHTPAHNCQFQLASAPQTYTEQMPIRTINSSTIQQRKQINIHNILPCRKIHNNQTQRVPQNQPSARESNHSNKV